MNRFSRSAVPSSTLLRDARRHLGSERDGLAHFLADLAEIDERRLYAPAGHDSILSFALSEWHLSRPSALKRIRAARAARRCPAALEMIADGRLGLSALVALAAHLTPENAAELLSAATHRSCEEIERLVALRLAPPDLPACEPDEVSVRTLSFDGGEPEVSARTLERGPEVSVRTPAPASPLAPGLPSTGIRLPEKTMELVRRARALLGHRLRSDEPAKVIHLALEQLVEDLSRRSTRPARRPRPRRADSRHVPEAVRRAVWERDGGRCTFVSAGGHRCGSRAHLEFDHVEPVSRGGRSTTDNLRLRCRAHNQYEAERAFGAGYMDRKRRIARNRTGEKGPELDPSAEEVVPVLQSLGIDARRAREAALACEPIPDASLEERVRAALRRYGRIRYRGAAVPRPTG